MNICVKQPVKGEITLYGHRMTLESWLNGYYRTIISSFNGNNTQEQNLLLLAQINDLNPALMKEAYELIVKGNVVKYQLNSTKNNYSFYIIDKEKQYLTTNGYCSCFKFRDNVLAKEKEFTCIHEITSLIVDHIDPNLDENLAKIKQNTVQLNELEFVTKLQSYSNF